MKKKSRLKSFFAILLAISMVFQQSSLTVLATDDTYAEDVTATPTPSESEAEEYTEEEAEPEAEEPVAEEPEEPQEEPETPAEEPAQEPTEAPAEQPTEAPAEQPTEAPAAEPTEAPATEVTEAPAAPEVTDTPAAEATATPVPEVSAVPSETPTPTPTEAPKTSFRYEDSRVVITAIAPEDANLPQNAEIKADYIAPGTDRYNAAVAAFNSQLSSQLGLNAKNTTAEYVLYDVYFLTADGKRIEPESGNVKVDMSFKQIQESTVDGDVVNKDVVHLDNEGQAEVVTEYINTNADGEITSMGFTQDSFSIVGGVTTYGAPSTGEENNSGKEAKLTDLVKAGGLTVSATSSVENVNRKGTLEFAFSYVIDDDKLDTAKNNPTWVYDISSLLSSAEGGVFSSIVEDSVGIIYDGNTNAGTYKVKNGKVYLYIDSSYIQNHTSDVKGTFLLNCSFDSSVIKTDSEKEIEFPGITDKTVVKFEEVKTETSKKVQGQQADDGRVVWSADGKLNYEITFKANADLDKLVLTDTLGAGQEIVGGKIKINDNIEVPVTVKNGVFTVDVKAALGKEIKAGDYYKVTYQTTVENTGWNSEITNKASWNWEGTKNTPEDETKITVKRDVTQKTVTKSETTKEDGTKDTVFTYTITVGDGVTDLNGYRLIDKMSKNQKYVEGSFSVTPELPGLTPIPPTDFSSDDNQQHTFLNYTFSKSTTSKYTITYKTTTEGTDLSGWHNVKNDIETLPPGENDGNKDSTYESVDYGSKSKAEIEKKFEKFDPTNDGSYVWWTITVKVPTGTTLNNVRVQENDMGYSDKDGGPKSTDGYAIDASKVTVVKEKDGSSVEAYTYDASSRSFIFGSLSDNIIIKIPFIYEAGFATITGAGKWFYNKGTLYVDNWTYIGEDSAKARYLSTYDVTKSHGNYNKKTREVTWSVVINDLAKTYTPDKNVTFKDTIPDGMSYKEGSFNVKVNDGAETAIVPTVENNTISARLGGLSGNKYIVTYTTVVDSKFLNDSHTYTNCVKVYDEGEKELTGTEDSITINHTYIAKSSDGIKANDKLDYTITVNEEGLKLSDEATLTLIDELPEGVELMPNGIEGKTIFAADGENQPVNISYELVGRKLTITIPDEKHVVIKYRVRVSELGDQELINRVTLSGKVTKSTEDKKNVTVNSHGATISGSNDEFMFEKSNSDLSEKLSGATFKVYSVTYDKDTKKITGDPTLHCEVITDQNGQAKVTDIKAGVIYYWVETNPPAGYEISDPSKHYFIRYDDTTISKNTATALVSEIVAANEDISEIMITKGGITKTVTDRKVNLTISKIVTGGDASEYAESFKIKVTNTERINLENAIVSNVVENSVSISGSTIEFSIAGNSTVSIKDLPAGTYTVEEMNGANVVYQTSYKLDGKDVANAKFKLASASDGHSVEITNTYPEKGILILIKKGVGEMALAGAEFELYKTGNPETLIGTYTTGEDGKITVDGVEPGSYYFKETKAPAGYVTPSGDAAKTGVKEVAAGQTEVKTYTFEMSNTEESKGKLELLKTGAEGAALEGAKFDLYKVGNPDEKRGSYVTGKDGKITVDDVEPGSYYFVETEAPAGYVTPAGTAAKTETVVVEAGQASVVLYTINV
ncbi:SpaA isopeptide-forming pilin-related protein, partial [Blautia sp. HCP3S3_H10_1]|uniref:SpaA isopeptide-forming pilin-related protein n=1 Tax=unclassified Blautia TaxID=2648079 RepID=UPI003F91AE67